MCSVIAARRSDERCAIFTSHSTYRNQQVSLFLDVFPDQTFYSILGILSPIPTVRLYGEKRE